MFVSLFGRARVGQRPGDLVLFPRLPGLHHVFQLELDFGQLVCLGICIGLERCVCVAGREECCAQVCCVARNVGPGLCFLCPLDLEHLGFGALRLGLPERIVAGGRQFPDLCFPGCRLGLQRSHPLLVLETECVRRREGCCGCCQLCDLCLGLLQLGLLPLPPASRRGQPGLEVFHHGRISRFQGLAGLAELVLQVCNSGVCCVQGRPG